MFKMRNADLVLLSLWILTIPFDVRWYWYVITFTAAWIYNAIEKPTAKDNND